MSDFCPEAVENFSNKVWNSFRLISSWTVSDEIDQSEHSKAGVEWFEQKFNLKLLELEDHFDKYRISDALMIIYKLVWDDLCSWYLEIVKPGFEQPIDRITYNQTISFFKKCITIMHPFMPFITEEIWSNIKSDVESPLIVSDWPKSKKVNESIIDEFKNLKLYGFKFNDKEYSEGYYINILIKTLKLLHKIDGNILTKHAITKLVAHYLMNEKNKKGLPINDVCRFHLGNGAIIDDVIINANVSEVGFRRSFGIMVNYLYELKNIEKNHEEKDPNVVKVLVTKNIENQTFAKAIDFFRVSNKVENKLVYHHVGIYAFTNKALIRYVSLKRSKLEIERKLEQMRALENQMKIDVGYIDACPLSVDTENDLKEVRRIMANDEQN